MRSMQRSPLLGEEEQRHSPQRREGQARDESEAGARARSRVVLSSLHPKPP
jgi:hypothetical protein